jgi:hypothetical protein
MPQTNILIEEIKPKYDILSESSIKDSNENCMEINGI